MDTTPGESADVKQENDTREFLELMDRVRSLSHGATRELVQRYGQQMLRVIRWRLHEKLRPKFDSQDFVQSVWASFFALPLNQYAFEDPEDLTRFLAELAQNKVVDAVRQRLLGLKYNVNREQGSLDDPDVAEEVAETESSWPTPEEIAIAQEEWQRLMEQAPSHHREILRAAAKAETLQQLAAELGVSERTIRRVLRHT
jgi:RNA polymerase sigma factor (sigma-70 family)